MCLYAKRHKSTEMDTLRVIGYNVSPETTEQNIRPAVFVTAGFCVIRHTIFLIS